MPKLVGLTGLIPVSFTTLTLANSTALGLNATTLASASVIVFSVETNTVRMRADGTAPTRTTGVLFQTDQVYSLDIDGSTNLKFQRTTGTAKVSVQSFRAPGTVIGGR